MNTYESIKEAIAFTSDSQRNFSTFSRAVSSEPLRLKAAPTANRFPKANKFSTSRCNKAPSKLLRNIYYQSIIKKGPQNDDLEEYNRTRIRLHLRIQEYEHL